MGPKFVQAEQNDLLFMLLAATEPIMGRSDSHLAAFLCFVFPGDFENNWEF